MTHLSAATLCLLLVIHVATAAIVALRLRGGRRLALTTGPREPVGILVPVAGLPAADARKALTALALVREDDELVYCAFDEREPIVAPIRAAIARHPGGNVRILAGRDRTTGNPKLDNMEKGYAALSRDIIVSVDGNVAMDPGLVEEALALMDARTGVVSSPAIGTLPEGFAAEVDCAFLNPLYARWQLAADAMGSGYAQGKVLVFRKSMIEAAGGFETLGADTAEDSSATKIARRSGLKVRLLRHPVEQPLGRRTIGEVWTRYVRWAQLRRESFPALYAFEWLMTPLAPAVLAALASSGGPIHPALAVSGLLATWYAVEAMLAKAAGWPLSIAFPAACLVRDAMAVAIWPVALFKRSYRWRGETITIGADPDRARS
ncbi:MAG: glycosyltransferase [Mesorhizobium sp.]